MNRPAATHVRPARLDDAAAMAQMSRQFIEAGLVWRYTPRRVAAMIDDTDTLAVVACDGSLLRGFAVMHVGDVDAHLSLLCVHSAHRRRGIGRQLIDWMVASATVAGIETVALELRADNDGALAFYRGLGFSEIAGVAAYYDGRIAARRMVRRLRATTP